VSLRPSGGLLSALRAATRRTPVAARVTMAVSAATKPLPARSEVSDEDTWAVDSIFPTVDAFTAEIDALNELSDGGKWPSLARYRGTLASAGPSGVVSLLDAFFATMRRIQVIHVYGHLQHDTDTADDDKKAGYGRAVSVYYSFAEATSWIDSELVALPEADATALVASPEVAAAGYSFYLKKIMRARAHTLSAEGEELIAMASKAMSASTKAFGALNNADFVFPSIRDGQGELHELTLGNYIGHMRSRDRRRREAAFKGLYGVYGAHENSLAEVRLGVMQEVVGRAVGECALEVSTNVLETLVDGEGSRLQCATTNARRQATTLLMTALGVSGYLVCSDFHATRSVLTLVSADAGWGGGEERLHCAGAQVRRRVGERAGSQWDPHQRVHVAGRNGARVTAKDDAQVRQAAPSAVALAEPGGAQLPVALLGRTLDGRGCGGAAGDDGCTACGREGTSGAQWARCRNVCDRCLCWALTQATVC